MPSPNVRRVIRYRFWKAYRSAFDVFGRTVHSSVVRGDLDLQSMNFVSMLLET